MIQGEGQTPEQGYLTGQLLIAMPHMRDSRFARTVVYICAHNAEGAMGLVINRLVGSATFPDLLSQLGIETETVAEEIRVHFGGPVGKGQEPPQCHAEAGGVCSVLTVGVGKGFQRPDRLLPVTLVSGQVGQAYEETGGGGVLREHC